MGSQYAFKTTLFFQSINSVFSIVFSKILNLIKLSKRISSNWRIIRFSFGLLPRESETRVYRLQWYPNTVSHFGGVFSHFHFSCRKCISVLSFYNFNLAFHFIIHQQDRSRPTQVGILPMNSAKWREPNQRSVGFHFWLGPAGFESYSESLG